MSISSVIFERGPNRHDADPVGERYRLGDVVGHEHDGLAGALPDLQQHRMHAPPRQGVERSERLVHQQHLGLDRERARDLQALAHSARELGGEFRAVGIEPDHRADTCR